MNRQRLSYASLHTGKEALMALKFQSAGELLGLDWMLKAWSTPENLTLKSFRNDYTPVDASVAGDFTVANFTSYVDKPGSGRPIEKCRVQSQRFPEAGLS